MAGGESGAKALNASRMNSTGGLEFAPEIAAALSECVSSAELSWLALGYESKKALKLLATGSSGGYAALKPHLADDAVVYSAFKVACAGSQKLVFLSSIGPNAGGMASRHQHTNQLPATSRSAVQGLIRTAYSYSAVSPSCTLWPVAVRHALSLASALLSHCLCLPLSLLECLLAAGQGPGDGAHADRGERPRRHDRRHSGRGPGGLRARCHRGQAHESTGLASHAVKSRVRSSTGMEEAENF